MEKEDVKLNKIQNLKNISIVVIFLVIIAFIIYIAPNYIIDFNKDKIELIINNNDVTSKMKNDIYIDENGVVYLSKEDVCNYFDPHIYYDKQNKMLVTTSYAKVAKIIIGEKKMDINSSKVDILGTIIEKNNTIYIPFSEMSRYVYNLDLRYIQNNNTVVIDSLNRKLSTADIIKNVNVKYKNSVLSKNVDKIKKGEKVVYISDLGKWAKVRTQNGKIGYINKKFLTNFYDVRQNMEYTLGIDGKVNLVWDYYSEYAKAPDRTNTKIEGINVVSPSFFSLKKEGNGQIVDNVGDNGKKYIQWAHLNNYKVWAMFSNNSYLKTTSTILNNYKLKENLVNDIVELVEKYDLDGINLDFENMNLSDKDEFSRLIIELAPRLRDIGKVLSVDVTAPDGSENWSLCFDRNTIADVADYIVFMAYDQNGSGSPKEGTTAGYNWVENNINKFLNQEEVKSNKIILGIPFYTRLWKEQNGKIDTKVVDIKSVNTIIPKNAEKKWDEDLKQFYVEYVESGAVCKMWVEDENSIKEKINLMKKYNLSGVAFWEKDREPDSIWNIIDNQLKN